MCCRHGVCCCAVRVFARGTYHKNYSQTMQLWNCQIESNGKSGRAKRTQSRGSSCAKSESARRRVGDMATVASAFSPGHARLLGMEQGMERRLARVTSPASTATDSNSPVSAQPPRVKKGVQQDEVDISDETEAAAVNQRRRPRATISATSRAALGAPPMSAHGAH